MLLRHRVLCAVADCKWKFSETFLRLESLSRLLNTSRCTTGFNTQFTNLPPWSMWRASSWLCDWWHSSLIALLNCCQVNCFALRHWNFIDWNVKLSMSFDVYNGMLWKLWKVWKFREKMSGQLFGKSTVIKLWTGFKVNSLDKSQQVMRVPDNQQLDLAIAVSVFSV